MLNDYVYLIHRPQIETKMPNKSSVANLNFVKCNKQANIHTNNQRYRKTNKQISKKHINMLTNKQTRKLKSN